MQLHELIQRAAAAAGNDNRLAQALGYPNSVVAGWKSGTRTCAVEDRIQLAELAGVEVEEAIADALLERWQGKPKGDRLKEIFATRGWIREVAKS